MERPGIFLFSAASTPPLGPTQTPTQWDLGGSFPEAKRMGPEADPSPPSGAEVKKGGDLPPLPHTSS
jgi:hypothetical protein